MILIACEESQEVCKAFRERGHEAYSCDVLSTSGYNPEWHFRCRVERLLTVSEINTCTWDLIIAHPPCDYLTVSNNGAMKNGCSKYTAEQGLRMRQKAIDFFMLFVNNDCPRIAIENPIGIMSTTYRKPDQIIQPWQFGHGETKATCLWLKGLPKLQPTNIVTGRENKIWKMTPSENRKKLRSKTYPGIAAAFAEQWGSLLKQTA